MPRIEQYYPQELDRALCTIAEATFRPVAPLRIEAWTTAEPVPFAERRSGRRIEPAVGDPWGKLFECGWFHFTGVVPETARGAHVVLRIDVSGELCVVDADGVPVQGLTGVCSAYGEGKRIVEVSDGADGGERIDLWADAGCNDLFGNLVAGGTVREADIAVCDGEARSLFFDYQVLRDLVANLPDEDARRAPLFDGLVGALAAFDSGDTAAARAVLAPLLHGLPAHGLTISAVGHAHIDLAWLWPIRETIRKGARTFATVLGLLERYPDYVFGQSSPQLFVWMQEHYPELFTGIRAAVRAGRIEPQGAMWVEADTNLPGGESLIRQILLGQRWWRAEFGMEADYLWEPDVFGYTASLPQLLRKAGIDCFLTQKLSWSRVDVYPHHSFRWRGIDGSEVLAHLFPEDTYNSAATPASVLKIVTGYKDRDVSDQALLVYGVGDGGGGPGEQHLERLQRIRQLGLAPLRQERVADFLPRWRQAADRFHAWTGELYLEFHNGTYTTHGRSKRLNRAMELALRDLEFKAALAAPVAACLDGGTAVLPYPQGCLDAIWKEVLLYQFHDILPGTSIKRVYDESIPRYEALRAETRKLAAERIAALAERVDTSAARLPALLLNSLSWPRTEWVEVDAGWRRERLPALGYTVVDRRKPPEVVEGLRADAETLDNGLLTVAFSRGGSVRSIHDREHDRQVLRAGTAGNHFALYRDDGDPWDFPVTYRRQTPRRLTLVSAAPRIDGPRAVLRHVYRIGHSELVQEVSLTAGSRVLRFDTLVSWRETACMLRTSFPLAVQAEEATCDIQFGSIRRPTHSNTSWDLAKDEVAAHKWVDVSRRTYGAALLNDSKYGYRVKDSVLDLNLIRSVPFSGAKIEYGPVPPGEPDPRFTDQEEHRFSYALLPHAGDHVAGGVIQAAYELNVPVERVDASAHPGPLPADFSLCEPDGRDIVVETVKQAEEGGDLIIRLHEAAGGGRTATLHVGVPVADAHLLDLMERRTRPLAVRDGSISLEFGPYEIHTIALTTNHDRGG